MVLTAVTACVLAAGCSIADPGTKPGELNNGGFHFSCDDAVACGKYTDTAVKFPDAVALGSTFAVTFTTGSNQSGLDIHFNESLPNRGITVSPVSEVYISRGVTGLVAVKSGYATLNARDAAGHLVDYTVIRVAKPDALVVYSADQAGSTATPLDTIDLSLSGPNKSFRAFAQQNKANLAGSLQVEWTTSNPNVAEISSTTNGIVTLAPRSAGSAMLIVTGGAFTQQVPIKVTQ
jgi:hypothetical protein